MLPEIPPPNSNRIPDGTQATPNCDISCKPMPPYAFRFFGGKPSHPVFELPLIGGIVHLDGISSHVRTAVVAINPLLFQLY